MGFHPVYYIINSWPSKEKTLEMVDKYAEHGVNAVQIDMPSTNPWGESTYIQDRMKMAIDKYGLDYDFFMDVICEIRRRHPNLEIHQVLYNDIVDNIGIDKFADFCNKVGVYTVMVDNTDTADYLNEKGIRTTDFVMYYLPEEAILRAVKTKNLVMLRSNKDHPEWVPRDGMADWVSRVGYLRKRGVEGPIFAVAGLLTKEQLADVRTAKADGAYIGTALMKLWDREDELWKLLDELESVADRNN